MSKHSNKMRSEWWDKHSAKENPKHGKAIANRIFVAHKYMHVYVPTHKDNPTNPSLYMYDPTLIQANFKMSKRNADKLQLKYTHVNIYQSLPLKIIKSIHFNHKLKHNYHQSAATNALGKGP